MIRSNSRPRYRLLFLFADLLLASGALFLAYRVRFGVESFAFLREENFLQLGTYLLVIVLLSYAFGLYEPQLFVRRHFVLRRTAVFALTCILLLSAFFYLMPDAQFGRGLLFLALLFCFIGQTLVRLLSLKLFKVSSFANRVLILGTNELALKVAAIIPEDTNPYSYLGFISCDGAAPLVPQESIIGKVDELEGLIRDYRPHTVIVALKDRRGALPLTTLMHSKLRGIMVEDATSFYEKETGRLLIENIQPSSFIYADGFCMTQLKRRFKRVFDLFLSGVGILLAVPILLFVALLVKFDSPGSILYKQLRVGEREIEYFIYKFRTMRQDAEEETGAVWAQQNDPRVTRVGRFLRKTRLDEIPQLFNVLKGDMSFIGPRPERLQFVDQLKKSVPYYSTRHYIKPGVTGWAQVCYPYGASEADALEKLRFDLYYIKHYSFRLDFKILVETFRVVLSGFGGR